MSGKGSAPRPFSVPQDDFASNWDRIFGKKKEEEMISERDIEDWDKESQAAYLKWARDYGLQQEPLIGFPSQYAAWKAAVKWVLEKYDSSN